jgi:DNA topoisomerase-1
MIASQMESARIERTTIDLESADGQTGLRATGQVILFDGYLAVYEEGRDDADDEEGGRLPQVKDGASAKVIAARSDQHFTEPPPRYSEASLVKKMEELGIGRPRPTPRCDVLRDREYVAWTRTGSSQDKGRLSPCSSRFFLRYIGRFHRRLEEVGQGLGRRLDWKVLLREFWGISSEDGETSTQHARGPDRWTGAVAHLFPESRWPDLARARPAALAAELKTPVRPSSAARTIRNAATASDRPPRTATAPGDRELGVDDVTGRPSS